MNDACPYYLILLNIYHIFHLILFYIYFQLKKYDFANDIFQKHKGCCASEACAFAFIAKVCGYDKVTICIDDNKLVHVWVDIGGRLYDPLFAESRGFKKNYNAKYTDDRKHPAYTKKL